ncbi:MAG: hypothetical protein N2594_08455, partial [Clostridiales bacterium]|nr:hypothetical protein [Clostridiales bacterium]
MMNRCILDNNINCTQCNQCNICDLDPNKVCDNCMKCLNISEVDYKEISIDGIIEEAEYDDYIYDEETLISDDDITVSYTHLT